MEQTECIQLSQDEDQYTCMLCQPLKTDRTSGVPVFYILFGVYGIKHICIHFVLLFSSFSLLQIWNSEQFTQLKYWR